MPFKSTLRVMGSFSVFQNMLHHPGVYETFTKALQLNDFFYNQKLLLLFLSHVEIEYLKLLAVFFWTV